MLVIQMYTNTSLNIHLVCNDRIRKFATYENKLSRGARMHAHLKEDEVLRNANR